MAEFKTEVAEIKTEVAEIKTEVAEIKTGMRFLEERLENQMEIRQEFLENQIDNVRSGVNNGMAIQLNSLRKWLDDPIQPVSACVLIEDRARFTVAAGFPTTIREFWRLLSNKSTLVRLAEHYSIVGWERWQRNSSYDTDATSYDTIENAVAAYPSKCLRSLAMTWGLQYSALERSGGPQKYEGRLGGPLRQEGRLGKRKAETDNGSRRVREREDQDNNSTTGSESTSSQDVDDQGSQQSRVISVQVRVPARTEGRYGDLLERMLAAADERGHYEPREPSEVLGWKIESSTTTERRRRRFRNAGQSPAHTSELQGRSSTGEEATEQ